MCVCFVFVVVVVVIVFLALPYVLALSDALGLSCVLLAPDGNQLFLYGILVPFIEMDTFVMSLVFFL